MGLKKAINQNYASQYTENSRLGQQSSAGEDIWTLKQTSPTRGLKYLTGRLRRPK
jgi:hypothetical protein